MKNTVWVLLLAIGCAKPQPVPDPAPAADDSVSVEELAEVREYMWAMARTIRALDEELSLGEGSEADRDAVAGHLSRIDSIAGDLAKDNVRIKHPMLDDHLERFRGEVRYAIEQNRVQSAGYMNAGRVVGACSTCHDVRACPFDRSSRCIETVN
ncbi:MAG: hypothetical protein AAFU77_17400 [Myxococcota bacterium]